MHKRKRIKKLESRLMFTAAAKQAIVETIEWLLNVSNNTGTIHSIRLLDSSTYTD